MSIDKESNISANLQIGPTTLGMVRIYLEAEGIELPLDFDPDEALEIAEEIRMAAERARAVTPKGDRQKGPKSGKPQAKGRGPKGPGTPQTGPGKPPRR